MAHWRKTIYMQLAVLWEKVILMWLFQTWCLLFKLKISKFFNVVFIDSLDQMNYNDIVELTLEKNDLNVLNVVESSWEVIIYRSISEHIKNTDSV